MKFFETKQKCIFEVRLKKKHLNSRLAFGFFSGPGPGMMNPPTNHLGETLKFPGQGGEGVVVVAFRGKHHGGEMVQWGGLRFLVRRLGEIFFPSRGSLSWYKKGEFRGSLKK